MTDTPDKVAALADTVRAPDRVGVLHAVVGGVAVATRSGVPRATLGTDIAVPSTVPLGQLIETLTGAGLRLTDTFAHSANFRHASGEPVQIVFDPEFNAMIDRAEVLDVAGVRVRVVTTLDLVALKRRAASDPARRRSKALRDQPDIALLQGDVAVPMRAGDRGRARPLVPAHPAPARRSGQSTAGSSDIPALAQSLIPDRSRGAASQFVAISW